MASEYLKKRYDKLNIAVFCPCCCSMTALNKLKVHMQKKKCKKIYDLLSSDIKIDIEKNYNTILNKSRQGDKKELIKFVETVYTLGEKEEGKKPVVKLWYQ